MLEIISLCKNYNQLKAVDNISFKIFPGKIYGLLGPNGAGKTTTIRMILDILKPDCGKIYYNGNEISTEVSSLIGYLPEERGLYKKSKIKDLLTYFAKLKGMKSQEIKIKIDYWLNRLEIEKYKYSKLENLSKGNQQKIQLITSIIHDPEVLILDEPFSGFDPMNQQIVRDILNDYVKENRIVIISTHMMEMAENLCDEILLINNGKLIVSDNLEKLKLENIKDLYEVIFLENNINYNNLTLCRLIDKTDNKLIIQKNANATNQQLVEKLNLMGSIQSFRNVTPSLNEIFLNLISVNN